MVILWAFRRIHTSQGVSLLSERVSWLAGFGNLLGVINISPNYIMYKEIPSRFSLWGRYAVFFEFLGVSASNA